MYRQYERIETGQKSRKRKKIVSVNIKRANVKDLT
jgi:hypothetical protein